MNIRPARVGDVPAIHDLIRTFAERKLMIRRSPGELYEAIREFIVATDDDGKVVGCAGLHVFWEDLAELKCLAVSEEAHGQGVGRRLVEACWDAARELELTSVFTLTYVPGFFEQLRLPPHRQGRAAAQDLERVRPLPPLPQLQRDGPDPLRRDRSLTQRPRPRGCWGSLTPVSMAEGSIFGTLIRPRIGHRSCET